MTVTEIVTTWEDQVLETVRQGQEAVLKAVGMWAEAGANLQLPKTVSLPYSDQMPSSAELVERYFDYSAKLLNAQKDFVGAVINAVEPVLGTNGTTPAGKK